jgi:quercetin dioxygenase-like cupin family protein
LKVTRIYPDSKGETHFEDVEVQLESVRSGAMKKSRPLKASAMTFGAFEGSLSEDWHNASRKQAIIILSGEVTLAVSDGSRRIFGPGHVLLLEDTTGKGHTTRSVDGKMREEVWVALE